MSVRAWAKKAADAVFPEVPACVVCDIETGVEKGLCGPCRENLDVLRLGQTQAAGLSAWSAYRYDADAARIVRGYKYGDKRWLCRFMGAEMAQGVTEGHERAAAVCHVPLHPKRAARRGFDQAELLAREVSLAAGVPFVHALVRVKNTKTQTKLSAAQRSENVAGAFACIEGICGYVVLIDDVLTTGATAAECARVLKQHGAETVRVVTFARAEFGGQKKSRLAGWLQRLF